MFPMICLIRIMLVIYCPFRFKLGNIGDVTDFKDPRTVAGNCGPHQLVPQDPTISLWYSGDIPMIFPRKMPIIPITTGTGSATTIHGSDGRPRWVWWAPRALSEKKWSRRRGGVTPMTNSPNIYKPRIYMDILYGYIYIYTYICKYSFTPHKS